MNLACTLEGFFSMLMGKESLEGASLQGPWEQKDGIKVELNQPMKGMAWCAYDSSKCNSAGNRASRLMICSEGFQHIQSLITQTLQVWQTIEQTGHRIDDRAVEITAWSCVSLGCFSTNTHAQSAGVGWFSALLAQWGLLSGVSVNLVRQAHLKEKVKMYSLKNRWIFILTS